MTLAPPPPPSTERAPSTGSSTPLRVVPDAPDQVEPWPRTGRVLREILTQDIRCRRRWQRHAHRLSARGLNQAAVAMVLALELWDRGDIPESHQALPRSLKDRVSRALTGRLISGSTLALFAQAFDMTEEQESRLYAAWELDSAHLPHPPA